MTDTFQLGEEDQQKIPSEFFPRNVKRVQKQKEIPITVKVVDDQGNITGSYHYNPKTGISSYTDNNGVTVDSTQSTRDYAKSQFVTDDRGYVNSNVPYVTPSGQQTQFTAW